MHACYSSQLLVETLVYAEAELLHYFHITYQRLKSLLVDLDDTDGKEAEVHENIIAGPLLVILIIISFGLTITITITDAFFQASFTCQLTFPQTALLLSL